ncbi:MAG TPA: hypothetical protein DCS93_34095 [Microscillaceae bacterium]|nr:hypothetical protein [Microscillaceae bacterium]
MKHHLCPILWLVFGLLFCPFTAQSQYFWNTDFEYGTSNAQPRKWVIEGEGRAYAAKVDKQVAKHGKSSLKMTVTSAMVYIYLPVSGTLLAGKQLSIEGYAKTELGDSLTLGAMLLHTGSGQRVMIPPQPLQSLVWQPFAYQAKLPTTISSGKVLLTLLVGGQGTAWLDNVTIRINGKVYGKDAPGFRASTPQEINQLNQQLKPLKSIIPTTSFQDLAPLKAMLSSAKIVALGENSHGSASIFTLKLRLVQYLVQALGFNTFVLECPAVEAEKVNAYVVYNQGNLSQVMPYLIYKSWQTQEMAAIVQWLHDYNQQHQKKVAFWGIDMQYGQGSLKYLQPFISKHPQIKDAFAVINSLYPKKKKTPNDWKTLKTVTQQITVYLNTPKHFTQLISSEYTFLKYSWRIFSQSIQLQNTPQNNLQRDAFIAENIQWLRQNYPGSKLMVSADNDHIRKSAGKAGYLLHQKYGKQYKAIGFTFQSGTYQAYGSKPFYQVHPSYVGTYEYLFSKASTRNFYLDLNQVQHIPLLDKPAGFRSIGSRPQETTQFAEITLKNNFDILFYLEQSRHTTYLQKK